jgi:hypothetical protein
VSRFAPRHNAANAFARLLSVGTVAPFSYPQADRRIYEVDVLLVCSRYKETADDFEFLPQPETDSEDI